MALDQTFFPSRWPIMCAVMNGVSDLNLALAVNQAGAMPSLMIVGDNRVDQLHSSLKEFVRCTGHGNIVLQLNYHDLTSYTLMKSIKQFKISHVELIGELDTPGMTTKQEFDQVMQNPMYAKGLKFIQSISKTIIRVLTPCDSSDVSAYALKGNDSAGFGGALSVSELFDQQKQRTPDMNLITYGGVGTPKQVADYIQRGAAGVAVGTLFAATQESCLSTDTKHKMISANSAALVKFETTQQALILGDPVLVASDSTPNRQTSLDSGIAGLGGLVYAGSAIDYVTEIRTVKQVVDYLAQDLLQ